MGTLGLWGDVSAVGSRMTLDVDSGPLMEISQDDPEAALKCHNKRVFTWYSLFYTKKRFKRVKVLFLSHISHAKSFSLSSHCYFSKSLTQRSDEILGPMEARVGLDGRVSDAHSLLSCQPSTYKTLRDANPSVHPPRRAKKR